MKISKIDWHGWTIKSVKRLEWFSIYIGIIPGRKRIALYTFKNNTIIPMAYFISEEQAKEFLDKLDSVFESIGPTYP